MIWGIDVGGTSIKLGLFENDKIIFFDSIKTNTLEKGKFVLKEISDYIKSYHLKNNLPLNKVRGIGFGVPGPVKNNVVIKAPNIGWEELDVKNEFIKLMEMDLLVLVANDANMAALGEFNVLNLKDDIAFITLGTGVGGAFIINGKVLEGFHGGAGEVGHIKVVYDNPEKCSCGLEGCIETVCGISGLSNLARKTYDEEKYETSLKRWELKPIEIFNKAREGKDELAIKIVDMYCDYLARGCAAISVLMDPKAILIGGGISNSGDILINTLKEKYLLYAHYGVKDVEFLLASLGNDAGMYGAYYLVKNYEE